MYSLIQLCAVMLFFVSFVPPFWVWGHLLAMVVFFWAGAGARRAIREEKLLKEMEKVREKGFG